MRLLDLFCGAGGCSVGYHRAGFTHVVGVDNRPMPRYPFEFVQGDALEYLAEHGHKFDAIHASPPCQAHSIITPNAAKHPDFIPETRSLLELCRKPWVIENVKGAARSMQSPIELCGNMFGLKVYRHRLFECSCGILAPAHPPHREPCPKAGRQANAKRRSGTYGMSEKGFVCVTGHFSGIDYCRDAMGIAWMNGPELAQAIPPAYTEFIGRQLIDVIRNRGDL